MGFENTKSIQELNQHSIGHIKFKIDSTFACAKLSEANTSQGFQPQNHRYALKGCHTSRHNLKFESGAVSRCSLFQEEEEPLSRFHGSCFNYNQQRFIGR